MGARVVRRRVVVSGRVQGVFFRDTCREEARRAGLAGWVTNRRDGTSVEAVFEGDEAAVERLVAWCHRGPPRAAVTGVEVVDEEPRGETAFLVR